MRPNPCTYENAVQMITAKLNPASGMTADPAVSGDPSRALVRMTNLFRQRVFPESQMPVIHVAGSIGKGSTCAILAEILVAAGYRTGVYTSPHLHAWRERIAIQGKPVPEEYFGNLACQAGLILDRSEREHPELGRFSAFEMLTTMAILGFAEQRCEVAVIEVGLGGTYDPTNFIEPSVAVITRIDQEHTTVLGHTFSEIAVNKAGIIKPGRPIVSNQQEAAAAAVIIAKAVTSQSPLLMGHADFWTTGETEHFSVHGPWGVMHDLRLSLRGRQQMDNAATAIAALRGFPSVNLRVSDDHIRQGVEKAALPGRFELAEANGIVYVLDVAHSPAAAISLRDSLATAGYVDPVWIVGMLSGRQPGPFLAALIRSGEKAIFTQTAQPRSIPAATLLAAAPGRRGVTATNLETAIKRAAGSATSGQPVVVSGSVELVARVRELLGLTIAAQ